MRRLWVLAAALVASSLAQPSHAGAQTWFGFQVGISGGSPAPPPYMFRQEPRVVVVNDVYVVDDDGCDDDVFRHRGVWWRMHAGHWYRSSSWRGPWVTVDVRRVPERVLVVPARHWKHHPRYTNRGVVVVRDGDRGRGHRKHRGRGNGHAHHDHD
jgi:hypothetical protein